MFNNTGHAVCVIDSQVQCAMFWGLGHKGQTMVWAVYLYHVSTECILKP